VRIALFGTLALVAALSWLLLAVLILTVAPEAPLAPLFFHALFFSAIAASGAAVAFVLDPHLPRPSPARQRLARALVYGLPPAVILSAAGWLQGLRLLTPLNAAMLLAIACLTEYVALPKTE
jgi:hypothetical protein